MSTHLAIKIDVSKIPREWIFQGKKGKYIDCVLFENDSVDEYGNTHALKLSPPREEREAGTKGIYIGNGKPLERKGSTAPPTRQSAPPRSAPRKEPARYPTPSDVSGSELAEDDVPFAPLNGKLIP